ncbi:MAG: kynureninase [Acidimicrobiia bacterium]
MVCEDRRDGLSLGALRREAEVLDRDDPLARFRDRFVFDDDSLIYLDGNSLGRLPKATVGRLDEIARVEWGSGLVRSWEHWVDIPRRAGDLLAQEILGARPGEVVLSDSTTVNLYKLAATALRHSERTTVIVDDENFTSDHYVMQGLCESLGRRLLRLPAADVVTAVDDDVALVVLSHVAFRTGHLLDGAAVTAAVRERGAQIIWDLSHSAGVVPIDLNGWAADLAVGCTYKHLNGGPGAPAFLYVSEQAQMNLKPVVQGWFGQRDRFAMRDDFEPAADASAWLVGTPPILSMAAAEEGIRVTAEAGVEAIRAKSTSLTTLLIDAADEALAADGFCLATPRDPLGRGSHVALRHPQAWQVCQALIANEGVVPDFREPDIVRLGVSPLANTHAEMVEAAARMQRVMRTGSHLEMPTERRAVT